MAKKTAKKKAAKKKAAKKKKARVTASQSKTRTWTQVIDTDWASKKIDEARPAVQNRKVSDKHVKFLVREILEGRWIENGVPVILDEDGFLIDGQHRLWAVIEADTPIVSLVVQGPARDEAISTIDVNRRPRTFADVMGMKDIIGRPIQQPRVVQAATKWLYKYRHKLMFQSAGAISVGRQEELLEREPGLVDGLHAADMLRGLMPSSGLTCFCYYIFAGRNSELADSFFEALATGANISATSPILALREKLIDHKVKKERRSMDHIAFIIFRAWLHYEAGLPLKKLTWRRQATETRPSEPFLYLEDYPTDMKKLQQALKGGKKKK